MNGATIITATRGIGFALAQHANNIGINSTTFGISAGNVGVSQGLSAQPVDHLIDIHSDYDLDAIQFAPSRYLIWSTGAFLKIPLSEMTDTQIENLSELHYNMPLRLIHRFHRQQKDPYHLIVIASCSSWRLRDQEAVYCGLSAAKATFTRNFAGDLHRERPGSKVSLINPGGVRTPFYYELDEEGDGFIDQTWLANAIWSAVFNQENIFQELQILRQKPPTIDGLPTIEFGQKLPEVWRA